MATPLNKSKSGIGARPQVFTYSFVRPLTSYVLLLVILVPIEIIGFASFYWSVGSFVYLLLLLLVLGSAVRLYSSPVHRAWFYDDGFRVNGRNLERAVAYSQASKVTKLVGFPLLNPRTQVGIWLKGEAKPVVIRANPRNKKLGTDLYSWLAARVRDA